MIRFGPAGNSLSFYERGYKKQEQIPGYLSSFGLTAFEVQCGRGVRITTENANRLGVLCKERDIALSLHAPYYISLSSVEEEKRLGSLRYILESARAVTDLGGQRIVIHAGSCGKMPREEALALAKDTMTKALAALDENGYSHVIPCPETMGKVNQLGTLDEVLELCTLDERMLPCIDFGHLYARSFGEVKGRQAFAGILDRVKDRLGEERMRKIHIHFSRIRYTVPGGEKCHLTFADRDYGPDFEPLMDLLYERDCSATVICESDGTQAEDAATMSRYLGSR